MAEYVKIVNGKPVEYSLGKLRLDNPNTSFPKWPDSSILEEFDVYELKLVERPQATISQDVYEGEPQLVNGTWTQNWVISELSNEEVSERKQAKFEKEETLRREAYQKLSDPLFFKWQRGEATKDEWLTVVSQIKDWYSTNDKN